MIKIVLFDDNSIFRIINRISSYFSGRNDVRLSDNNLWLAGTYLSFKPRSIIVNIFNQKTASVAEIRDCLDYALRGEEVCLFKDGNSEEYISCVTKPIDIPQFYVG